MLFSTVTALIYIPTISIPFLYILNQHLLPFFDNSHFNRSQVITPCGLDLQLPNG